MNDLTRFKKKNLSSIMNRYRRVSVCYTCNVECKCFSYSTVADIVPVYQCYPNKFKLIDWRQTAVIL